MKLTHTALTLLNDRMVALKIAVALGFSEQWIVKVIAKNKENGPLTTARALAVIKAESGLTDTEILEEQSTEEAQK